MTDQILVTREAAIATIAFNRPEKLNALTKSMWRQLAETVEALSGDDSLRCLVLRGTGGKAFSPGNDISEFETERANRAQAKSYGDLMHRALGALKGCRLPTLAMIEGICVGGGLEIAALCDLRVCGRSSRFGVPINRLGLVMAYPEVAGLKDLVGRAAALEILLEGRVFGADEALQKGLVNRVVEDSEVEAEAFATARRIAAGAPLVARWHKKFLRRLEDPAPLSETEMDEGYECFDTKDFEIGYQAFLAKRQPEFEGR